MSKGYGVVQRAILAALADDDIVDPDGWTLDELNATVDDLCAFVKQEVTVVSGPRVVQAWGRRPTG
jgi:hypothetical protein